MGGKYLSHFIRNAQNVFFRTLALSHVNRCYAKSTGEISLASDSLNSLLRGF